jgi:hypothetical protein
MHRMHRYVAVIGLVVGAIALSGSTAEANLIRTGQDKVFRYPDLASFSFPGRIEYDFDEGAERGLLTITSTPLLFGFTEEESNLDISDPDGGARQQTLKLVLDRDGNVLDDPANTFTLDGKVTAGGKTYNGPLLVGTPKKFGWSDGADGMDAFDLDIDITGGQMADLYGDTAYMEITSNIESTFAGSFANDFSGLKTFTNVRSYSPGEGYPIPEPTTIVVLLSGGAGLLYRRLRPRLAD